MDKEILTLISVVLASGCLHSSVPAPDPATPAGSGLEVKTFDLSDSSISPGQRALITLELKNFHDQEIPIEDISLYNTGSLEVERQGCTPSDSEIEGSRDSFIPTVECTWTVTAPEINQDSRTIPVKLNLAYRSELSNSDQPVKIHFKPLDQIERTNDIVETFSNGEVQMEIETESPVQFEGTPVTFTVSNSGPGRVDSDYRFEYFPSGVLSSCPENKEPLVESEASFSCEIEPQTENAQTRNMVVSTSYKYIKSPTLDIEVVNP